MDFGCVKSVVKDVCKEMNEYFLVPTLSEVLTITVSHDDDDKEEDNKNDQSTNNICGECGNKNSKPPASVTIQCEDGSTFMFPKQDCLLLPIMHSTAEELAIYLYGRILQKLNADYLIKRGVSVMEVIVSEAVGQDAVFRREIPVCANGGDLEEEFAVGKYISMEEIPPMPCPTETMAAKKRKADS